jgi:hypothetical protein
MNIDKGLKPCSMELSLQKRVEHPSSLFFYATKNYILACLQLVV